ncbi:lysylphosphatidylglycerol synthase transmembrane domain-containing protein [Algoriphagus sediminis]|uniref:Lysylphosphatidylglycerol synthase transmembrane domain-containing protein n=1 Tax=Algoriphagus sediminis TaxID=3057113 RepID=A0ABT7YCF1_9BACT|nr:lysylphosphatidylglycerol synthase transmembrane domain-containing protein [Algoriphagus sediminis]MDN3204204.1 lysylphosphatidylglycerol synthase transmembrane domain-containing protein [Algoriphagus sediminis]
MKLPSKIKQIIQVTISLLIALWIFWYLYKDIEFEALLEQLYASNWGWIFASLTISVVGFWIRGWRWTLIISDKEGTPPNASRAYHAVMVGYLVNLLVPRAGEVAKCGVLSRSNGIPLGHLIGTVILERTIDLLFMIGVILLAFFLQNQLFLELANEFVNFESLWKSAMDNLPIFLGGTLVLILSLYLIGRRFRNHGLVQKIQAFFRDIAGGLKQINAIKNPLGFWLSSVAIWIIYFLTLLLVAKAIQSTAILSLGEILLVMVMGTIGMLAPVQGGIGTFHALVALILIQFGVSETDGKIFAAIIHGTQMILMVIAGLISWVWILRLTPKSKPVAD